MKEGEETRNISTRIDKRSKAERYNLDLKIIQVIGLTVYGDIMEYKDMKITRERLKDLDGEVTFNEIYDILKRMSPAPLPSERTLREHLKGLRDKKFIESTGRRWGKEAIYSLTEEGKQLFWNINRYRAYQQEFFTKWITKTPLIMAFTETPFWGRVAETFMVVTDTDEVSIIDKAEKHFISKNGNSLRFFENCALAQKMGLLFFCKSIVDPKFATLEESTIEKLFEKDASMIELMHELLELSEENEGKDST
jgi:DNA-binding PadR family transcriptional regulator